MNLSDSSYLISVKPLLCNLLNKLSSQFCYASILAQDSIGMRISVSKSGVRVNEDTLHTKRGFVVRVHNGKALTEYSFMRSLKNSRMILSQTFRGLRRALKETIRFQKMNFW